MERFSRERAEAMAKGKGGGLKPMTTRFGGREWTVVQEDMAKRVLNLRRAGNDILLTRPVGEGGEARPVAVPYTIVVQGKVE